MVILQPNPMRSALDPLDLQLLFDVCLTWSGDEKDCGHDQLRDWVRPPTSHGTGKVQNPTKLLSYLEQPLEYTCPFAFLSISIAVSERYHRMWPLVIASVRLISYNVTHSHCQCHNPSEIYNAGALTLLFQANHSAKTSSRETGKIPGKGKNKKVNCGESKMIVNSKVQGNKSFLLA